MKMSRSLERYKFQMEKAMNRKDATGPALIKMYEEAITKDMTNEQDLDWQKNNMEYDLRSSKELCDKVKQSDNYAQNLYAAMCNMDWQSRDFWQELKGETWSCSWRHAGGIVADMQEKGDYIDWYCSGIKGDNDSHGDGFVPESTVTEEIREDFFKLGWIPVDDTTGE